MLLLLLACKDNVTETGWTGSADPVTILVDPTRPEHFFDTPFPSDDMLSAEGVPDLTGFPEAPQPLAASIIGGWATRIGMTVHGFANNGPIYFRFDGEPSWIADYAPVDGAFELSGGKTEPVVLIAMDGSELIPLTARWVADPQGDPFYAANTLAVAPMIGHSMKSGTTYAAVVLERGNVTAAEGYVLPDGVAEAVERNGIDGYPAAAATVFTTQDALGEMQALFADADARIPDLGWDTVTWKQVASLDFAQGFSESGEEATIVTTGFTDGTTEVALLGPADVPEDGTHFVDLTGWPVSVYQAYVSLPNYSGLTDRPYMSPGLAHVGDTDRYTGWIDFTGFPAPPEVTHPPDIEQVRVVLSLPRSDTSELVSPAPLVIWDHGTGGHAYHMVHRSNPNDDGLALATIQAEAGVAMLGHDAPLYGTRYPLIDEGYGSSLGFYNIVNLPAFRDNQRQTAVDGHMLREFAVRSLNSSFAASIGPEEVLDAARLRRGGHSLGSVTSNIGVAAEPEAWEGLFLYGSGGLFTHFFLDTGLLDDLDPTLIESLFGLVGAEVPDEVTAATALAAIAGLPEEAWPQVDRLHPIVALFQWTMDPSDPMTLARYEALPAWMIECVGDHQVPNFTSEALAEALPDVTLRVVTPTTDDYDPHQCMHREVEGQAVFSDWLASLGE